MELIGSGWQFDVYAFGDGDNVLKRPASRRHMAMRVLRSYPELALRPVKLIQKVTKLVRDRDAALADLDRRDVDRSLLANFRKEDGQFVQDRATPLDDALAQGHNPKRLIDRYVQSIASGWASGFAETSFNWTVNHGLTEQGFVVVLDVGELTFDIEEALRHQDIRLWERAFSAQSLDPDLKAYFLKAMEDVASPYRLRALWRDAPIVRSRPMATDRPARKQPSRRPVTEIARETLLGQRTAWSGA